MTDNIAVILDQCLCSENWQYIADIENTPQLRIRCCINVAIEYIGRDVIYLGEVVKLSWHHVESYLQSRPSDGIALLQDLYSHIWMVFTHPSISKSANIDQCVKFAFREQQAARAFSDFLSHVLPLRNTQYPTLNDNDVMMTSEQYYYCTRYTLQQKGKLSPAYLGDSFLKTLRADEFDFSYAFILGIVPVAGQTRRHQNLRPNNRKSYTITPEAKICLRHEKTPQYTAEQKAGFSQIQSCTLIDEKTLSPAFGFVKDRTTKLYGLMTNIADTLINRMLLHDSGTVARVFDHENEDAAENFCFALNSAKKTFLYPPKDLKKFKIQNVKSRPRSVRTNEVLARLRFNPYRSVVSICADTLEARLLAYDFAEELLEHFALSVKARGDELNPNFKIPIIFYTKKIPKNTFLLWKIPPSQRGKYQHELRLYTREMRQKDEVEAVRIYNDEKLRAEHYKGDNYEFLLGLEAVTPDILMENVDYEPLALRMIRNGYARMLMRLLRQLDHSNLIDLVARLTDSGHLIQNDSAISQLILAEMFDMADQFIAATKSCKDKLMVGEQLLSSYLIQRGNPRHIQYFGLEALLIKAASWNIWVPVMLCLKEYPVSGKAFLGTLLYYACWKKQHHEADFLLRMGADRTIRSDISPKPPIAVAAENKDWSLVAIFCRYPVDSQDVEAYGYALLLALRDRQRELAKLLLKAGAKSTWHNRNWGFELESTVFYAVEYGYDELLPSLIAHEKNIQTSYSPVRHKLAIDLAEEKNNEVAIRLLNQNVKDNIQTDLDSIKKNICESVCEALAVGKEEIAKRRLLRYLHQYELLPEDDNNVFRGFQIIQDYFNRIFSYIPSSLIGKVIEHIIEILMLSNDKTFLAIIFRIAPSGRYWYRRKDFTRTNAHDAVLNQLTDNNFSLVSDLMKSFGDKVLWQNALNEALANQANSVGEDGVGNDKAFLLLKLGARPVYTGPGALRARAIESPATKNNGQLVVCLLEKFEFGEDAKSELLNIGIRVPQKNDFTGLLLEKHVKVTIEHLNLAVSYDRKELLLPLLNALSDKFTLNSTPLYDYYKIWIYAVFKDALCHRKLATLLGPLVIRHYMLIHLLEVFDASTSVADEHWPKRFPNLVSVLRRQDIKGPFRNKFDYNPDFTVKHVDIIRILSEYFVDFDRGKLPDKDAINSTYVKIQRHFRETVNMPGYGDWFGSEFNMLMLNSLGGVDQLFPKSQRAAANDAVVPEPSLSEKMQYYFPTTGIF